MQRLRKGKRRATILVMIVGLLAMLFLVLTAYITLARFDTLTQRSVRQGQTVDEVFTSVTNVVLSAMRESLADGDGNLLAGGRRNPDSSTSPVLDTFSYEDIPGYRGSGYLAGNEPVRDARLQSSVPFDQLRLVRQIVSSFERPTENVRAQPLASGLITEAPGLMLEDYNEVAPNIDTIFEAYDVARNARRPFGDADGDGVAGSGFVATSSVTDIANAVAGVPTRAPGGAFNPSAIGDASVDPLARQWLRFNEQARYEVPVKVVSNGGMVALASPGTPQPPATIWNRDFVVGMFDWVRSPLDGNAMRNNSQTNRWLNELNDSAASVEPYLRHRGGLLPGYAEENLDSVPSVLKHLRYAFSHTFRAAYDNRTDDYQRFNLAGIDPSQPGSGSSAEWMAWRQAIMLDPDEYNTGSDARDQYVPRHLLTTISNSDELARENNPQLNGTLGIYPGQLKFYLGDIAAAFDANGYFVETDPSDPDIPRGNAIIRRLAGYYFEMLADYDGWGDVETNGSGGAGSSSEAVSLRQQAFMLAVNTVAFAAPRNHTTRPGFIDTVWYPDYGGRMYIGYAPQPFITQVLAHCEYGDQTHIALAVELFYPHEVDPDVPDPALKFNNQLDEFALDLSQFAISVNSVDGAGQPDLRRLDMALTDPLSGAYIQRLSGRNFVTLSIDDGNNTVFRNKPQIEGAITDLTVTAPTDSATGDRLIDVELWRLDSQGRAFMIDKMTVGDDPSATIPNKKANGDEYLWLVDYYRAADATPCFDNDWNDDLVPDAATRWGVVTNIHGATEDHDEPEGDLDDPYVPVTEKVAQLGNELPAGVNAPIVPLCTMNADMFDQYGNVAGTLVHGAYRPTSFPTVGFMHFIPRFSHTRSVVGAWRPMSEVLLYQWEMSRQVPYSAPHNYPADFGHMPIFDNRQEVRENSYYDDDVAGKIPWGLLVYDYFTTLNRYALDPGGRPAVDPLRVPGRVNINTAPWYVLAGLPVLNPDPRLLQRYNVPLDIDMSASPAFWSPRSGVLVGTREQDPLGSTGFDLPRFDPPIITDRQASWLRLGPYVAQAAVAYRDRIRNYTVGGPNPLWAADLRNDSTNLQSHYRREDGGPVGTDPLYLNSYAYGRIRRAHGFLSLGELANVYGFDSPVVNPAAPTDPTQFRYRPLGPAMTQAAQNEPDFFRAVSLMALLDTHFLTTRSNTFTVYVTVNDRENPQGSIRSQLTVDRSNLLPKLVVDQYGDPVFEPGYDQNGNQVIKPIIIKNNGLPEIVAQREIGYFNTQFDQ